MPEQLAGVDITVVLGQIREHYAQHSEFAHRYEIQDIHQYWIDSGLSDVVQVHIEYAYRQRDTGFVGCDARLFDLRRQEDGWVVAGMGARLSGRFHTWQCDDALLHSLSDVSTGTSVSTDL